MRELRYESRFGTTFMHQAFIRVHPRVSLINCFSVAWVVLSLSCTVEAADARKVLRMAMQSAESKLDPQAESDSVSGAINDNLFDALLQYDYLARPARLRPRTAEALPEVTGDG